MVERIRYAKVSDNLLESNRVLKHPSNGAKYRIRINLGEHKWYIIDDETEVVAVSGTNVDFNKAKAEVKQALNVLGIVLARGTRNRMSKQNEPS